MYGCKFARKKKEIIFLCDRKQLQEWKIEGGLHQWAHSSDGHSLEGEQNNWLDDISI